MENFFLRRRIHLRRKLLISKLVSGVIAFGLEYFFGPENLFRFEVLNFRLGFGLLAQFGWCFFAY